MNILVGDIGGTKTHLGLFKAGVCLENKKYSSRNYPHLSDIILEFLSPYPLQVNYACFGVAGPIEQGVCKTTNLPWLVSEKELEQELKLSKVWLINDLVAHGYGAEILPIEDFVVLNKGLEWAKGNKAIIAAGTGLGEAGFYWDGKEAHCFPSEGGHCGFAPSSDLEIELLIYIRKKYSHVSFERILSGSGFETLFYFFVEKKKEKTPDWFHGADLSQLSKLITQKALNGECAVSKKVLDLFISIYGSEAGNLALKFLAQGGVYIGGRLAVILLDALKMGIFMSSFKNKGRFSNLLSNIPVKVILNDNTAILGAQEYISRKIGITNDLG